MAVRSLGRRTNTRAALLPPAMHDFLCRRISELLGVTCLTVGGFLALSLAFYERADPSFNNATGDPTSNLLGMPGAHVADLALQWIGLAAILPALLVIGWGARLMAHRPLPRPGFRLALLVPTVILAAAALTTVPPPTNWPLWSGLGGTSGGLVLALVAPPMDRLGVSGASLALGLGMLSVVASVYILGARAWEWWALGRSALAGAGALHISLYHLLRRTIVLVRGTGKGFLHPKQQLKSRLTPPARTTPFSKLVAPRTAQARAGLRADSEYQGRLDLPVPAGVFELPPLELLAPPDSGGKRTMRAHDDSLSKNAKLLETVLDDFGIYGKIVKIRVGPVVTLYELAPSPGTKTSRVIGLADDIARSMSAVSVRIAVVPGRNVIGIELPNAQRELVQLRELLSSVQFERAPGTLILALGKDISDTPVLSDLARMPHLLIAGTTGSGKSVGINTMILSLLYRLKPDACKFIMIDPKMLELSAYDGIPHLLTPVVTDARKAVVALKWVVREMEQRYRSMSKLGVRDITGYNQRLEKARRRGETLSRRVQTGYDPDTGKPVFEEQPLDTTTLPYIVVIVDEMADLMLVAGKDVEAAIQRLAQMARAAGIHLIMATQRPSVDVVTGTIKANFPNRVSFQVTSKIDSRTILGEQGAEQLLGMGDMLYMAGGGRISRVHGPFVTEREVAEVVEYLKSQGTPDYIDEVTEDTTVANGIPGFEECEGSKTTNTLYDQAVSLIARERKASTSFIQRHLQIGYNRAARIIEQMEKEGVVSAANRVGRREVLIGEIGEESQAP